MSVEQRKILCARSGYSYWTELRPRNRYYNFFPAAFYWPDQLSKRSDKTVENELDRNGRFLKREILGFRLRRSTNHL